MDDRFTFRIWDKDEGKFLTRYAAPNTSEIATYSIGELRYRMWGYDAYGRDRTNSNNFIFQQCTGLTDKCGKDIYEGDIIQELEIDQLIWENQAKVIKCPIGQVVYEAEAAAFNVIRIKSGKVSENKMGIDQIYLSAYDGFYQWEVADYKVIGNILENPEFIK